MPGYERVANAWKQYLSADERVGAQWKKILLGHEWDGNAWKLIYAALSGVRNFRITRTVSSGGYTAWSQWTQSGVISSSGATSGEARAGLSAPASTSTTQYRLSNVNSARHITGIGPPPENEPIYTWTASAVVQSRSRSSIPPSTTYTAHWTAPEFGALTQYRIDREIGEDIIVSAGTLQVSLGSQNQRVRIRAENVTQGVEGPWTDFIMWTQ